MKKCTIWTKYQLRVSYHHLKATIIYMTASRSTIKVIDVTQSRAMFNFSLIINLI